MKQRVFGIDVGSYSPDGGFAWYELDSALANQAPSKLQAGRSTVDLADRIASAINNKLHVAIGLEAPIWHYHSAIDNTGNSALSIRFEDESGRGWWYQSGATSAILGMVNLRDVLTQVVNATAGFRMTDADTKNRSNDTVLIYESFLPRKKKPANPKAYGLSDHEWDAFVTAALYLEHRGRRSVPAKCGGKVTVHPPSQPGSAIVRLWTSAVPAGIAVPTSPGPPPLVLGWCSAAPG